MRNYRNEVVLHLVYLSLLGNIPQDNNYAYYIFLVPLHGIYLTVENPAGKLYLFFYKPLFRMALLYGRLQVDILDFSSQSLALDFSLYPESEYPSCLGIKHQNIEIIVEHYNAFRKTLYHALDHALPALQGFFAPFHEVFPALSAG